MDKPRSTRTASPEAGLELRELETRFRCLRLGWLVPMAIALTDVVATVFSLQQP
jgi:hypothetical protein